MSSPRVLITGAAGGLGRGLMSAFSTEGWEIIGVDVDGRPESQDRGTWIDGDITSDETIRRIGSVIGGRLDALVNNAAVQYDTSFEETSEDAWRDSLETNLTAAFRLSQALIGTLAACSGAIVMVGSVHGVATSRNVFPYAVSKSALQGLTRSIALEAAPRGVRCNAVLLGAIDTPMLRAGLSRRGGTPHSAMRTLCERTPLGFVAAPEDVAPTIVHLAGPESRYLTGQSIVIDGGASIQLATEA